MSVSGHASATREYGFQKGTFPQVGGNGATFDGIGSSAPASHPVDAPRPLWRHRRFCCHPSLD